MFSVRHQPTIITRKCTPYFRISTARASGISQIRQSRYQSRNAKLNTHATSQVSTSIPKSNSKDKKGWSTQNALLLAAATAGLAYTFAMVREKKRRGEGRDYADPEKFTVPRYANIKEMEMVSLVAELISRSGNER